MAKFKCHSCGRISEFDPKRYESKDDQSFLIGMRKKIYVVPCQHKDCREENRIELTDLIDDHDGI